MTANMLGLVDRQPSDDTSDILDQFATRMIQRETERFIREALSTAGFLELRRIEILEHEGHVTLHGTVSCYYIKQLAQTLAHKQPGVASIANRLHVSRKTKIHPSSKDAVGTSSDGSKP